MTNVYNMGAIAFGLIDGELDRSLSKWEGSRRLYEIAQKAIHPNRADRYSSVALFYDEWCKAVH